MELTLILRGPTCCPERGIYKEDSGQATTPASVTCHQVPRSSTSCKKQLHKYQGEKNLLFFFLVKTRESICKEGNLSPSTEKEITMHINSQ